MSTAFRHRVGAGVPSGGEFKATAHSDVVPALGVPATTPSTLPVGELIEVEAARYGAGYRDRMEAQYARLETDGGRTLFTQHLDARANPETRFDSRAIQGVTDTSDYDRLAELGYTDVNELAEVKRKNLRGLDTVLTAGITPERLAVLNAQPRHEFQWSAWERDAYLNAPLEQLEDAFSPLKNPRQQYLAAVTIGHPERTSRVREAWMLGYDKALVESDHDLTTLARLRDEIPDTKRNATYILAFADKGITAAHLKRYGVRNCTKYDAKALDAGLHLTENGK